MEVDNALRRYPKSMGGDTNDRKIGYLDQPSRMESEKSKQFESTVRVRLPEEVNAS
jgi:hypothetical protein